MGRPSSSTSRCSQPGRFAGLYRAAAGPPGRKRCARQAPLTALALGVLVASHPLAADETVFCNAFIPSLPYQINAPGRYSFSHDPSMAGTSGQAIIVNADSVVIDLNRFHLDNGGAGVGTQVVGIYSYDRKNVIVRNGVIRGFERGV